MTTFCIHCALKAAVTGIRDRVIFDETPEEHVKRVHPDAEATQKERIELELKFAEQNDSFKD